MAEEDRLKPEKFPIVTVILISVTTITLLVELYLKYWKDIELEKYIGIFSQGAGTYGILTLFTSIFIHTFLVQFLGNMAYLYAFGKNVEDNFGHIKFLLFYFFGGVSGAVVAMLLFHSKEYYIVGSNGAVGAMLGAFMYMFPKLKVKFSFWFTQFFSEEAPSFELPFADYLIVWIIFHFIFAIFSVGMHELFISVFGLVEGYLLTAFFMRGRPKLGVAEDD